MRIYLENLSFTNKDINELQTKFCGITESSYLCTNLFFNERLRETVEVFI